MTEEKSDPGKRTLDAATLAKASPGKVTQPVHPEKIPAPPESSDDGPSTDPGEARWVKAVKAAVRDEISSHEMQARDRYLAILSRFALQEDRWNNHEKRILWLERHGVARIAMVLLVAAVAMLGALVYFEYVRLQLDYQRIEMLRQAPVIRAEKLLAPGK